MNLSSLEYFSRVLQVTGNNGKPVSSENSPFVPHHSLTEKIICNSSQPYKIFRFFNEKSFPTLWIHPHSKFQKWMKMATDLKMLTMSPSSQAVALVNNFPSKSLPWRTCPALTVSLSGPTAKLQSRHMGYTVPCPRVDGQRHSNDSLVEMLMEFSHGEAAWVKEKGPDFNVVDFLLRQMHICKIKPRGILPLSAVTSAAQDGVLFSQYLSQVATLILN